MEIQIKNQRKVLSNFTGKHTKEYLSDFEVSFCFPFECRAEIPNFGFQVSQCINKCIVSLSKRQNFNYFLLLYLLNGTEFIETVLCEAVELVDMDNFVKYLTTLLS